MLYSLNCKCLFGRLFIFIYLRSFRLNVGMVWLQLFNSLSHSLFYFSFVVVPSLKLVKVGQAANAFSSLLVYMYPGPLWLGVHDVFICHEFYLYACPYGLTCSLIIFICHEFYFCMLARYGLTCSLRYLFFSTYFLYLTLLYFCSVKILWMYCRIQNGSVLLSRIDSVFASRRSAWTSTQPSTSFPSWPPHSPIGQ